MYLETYKQLRRSFLREQFTAEAVTSFHKTRFIEHVLSKLNRYHDKFTYGIENEDKLPFLDALVTPKD